MFDQEGHFRIDASSFQALLRNDEFPWLIDGVLLNCTPVFFETRPLYHAFLENLSYELDIHPKCFAIRGSWLLGFSLKPQQLWKPVGEQSDLDLAIIDKSYYEQIEDQVRLYDRLHPELRGSQYDRRLTYRKYFYHRYFDLPPIAAIKDQTEALGKLSNKYLKRPDKLNAFVFKDWWSLHSRWEYELQDIGAGLRQRRYPKNFNN